MTDRAVQEQHAPGSAIEFAIQMERFASQGRAHGRHFIVVARKAEDGFAKGREFPLEMRIPARIVLDQVPGGEDGLGFGDVFPGGRERRAQGGQRRNAA